MNINENEKMFYEPNLGIEGTMPELVDWANRFTEGYSDPALERISELASENGFENRYIQIPLLVRNERLYEGDGSMRSAYARLQIDYYLGNKISLCMSNFQGNEGMELEIFQDLDRVTIYLSGDDDEGHWIASNLYQVTEFIGNANNWLDVQIGAILFFF